MFLAHSLAAVATLLGTVGGADERLNTEYTELRRARPNPNG